MAYVLIDGYNLLGIAHNDLEKARSNLTQQLQKYSELKGHDITIVFDGWKSGQANETKTRVGNVTVIFSRLGEKADSLIKRILSNDPRQWVVVSSDREVADFADGKDYVSVSVDEFERKLYSSLYITQNGETGGDKESDDGIDLTPAPRKGNPWKLSKKQKKKIRALRKL